MVFGVGDGTYHGVAQTPVTDSVVTSALLHPVIPAGDGTYHPGTPSAGGTVGLDFKITVSDTAPPNPSIGDVWIDTS